MRRLIHILYIALPLLLVAPVVRAAGFVGPVDGLVKSKVPHTPDYYDATVRAAFKRGNWEGGKRLLDEGLKYYPSLSVLNELAGSYYYHKQAYDDARYYLVKSLRDNNSNVDAKQLMVKVEEDTKNYSSAICYVNELLEIHPYWKGLWRHKISLYRKQGNDQEADRLLHRLCQIYPNDAQLQKDLNYQLELRANADRKKGNKEGAIASLRELVKNNPRTEEPYLQLCNLLLQEGYRSEAIEVAGRGAANLPNSSRLVMKKAGILADDSRYAEAMAYVEQAMKTNRSPQLVSFYNSMQADAARAASHNDPYVLYGKVYERTKSQESLDYLLSTSITRGYYDNALYYIGEARKRKGDTEDLLYKQYIVNKRMGNTQAANNLLVRLYQRNPRNKDVAGDLAQLRLDQAVRLMSEKSYGEALPLLQFAAGHSQEKDVRESAYSRIVTCNVELRRYDAADRALAEYNTHFPGRPDYVLRHGDILNRSGRTEAALSFLAQAANSENDELTRAQYVNAYEETAVPYIKRLMAAGAVVKAYTQCENLLSVCPMSEDGLHYAVNASAQLQRWTDYRRFVSMGRMRYASDNFYIIKQAALYTGAKQFARADEILRPRVSEYLGDSLLIRANSGNSSDWAADLIEHHQADSALAVLNSALVFDRDNRLLLYTKGLAYEALHQYDSAYVYQKYYRPDISELASFTRHLNSLIARGYRNGLNFEYLQGRYGEQDVITAVASVEYTRKLDAANDIAVKLNYAGREGAVAGAASEEQVSGGTGLQLVAEWTHVFNDRWQATANAGVASKYFPQLMANLRVQRSWEHEWETEAHVGFRRIDSYKKTFQWNSDVYDEATGQYGLWGFAGWQKDRMTLLNLGLGASRTLGDFWFNAKLDGYQMSSKFYVNLLAQAKYFVLGDGKSCIQALASVGSAPEATMIDYAMPGTFNHLNTQVGLGGQYRVHRNVTLGILGTWYTYYTQSNGRRGTEESYTDYITTRYKNLFNVDAQILISF